MPYIRTEEKKEPSNKSLWRHLFLCERMLQCLALKVYGSPEAFRQDFQRFSSPIDRETMRAHMPHLCEKKEEVSE